MEDMNKKRRAYGEHLTPVEIFKEFILPELKGKIYDHIWVDLFAGEGNLILPILELVPKSDRDNFFKEHLFLFDTQEEMVEKAVKNAVEYGISESEAERNIIHRDTIRSYPKFLLKRQLPIYHITNPPYLYIGYIMKHKETQRYIDYFKRDNEGYQDLYQLALINDLRNGLREMIYIIPSNFIFGFSVSNKIREDVLKYYLIEKAIIFEREIFRHTGTNVIICFFKRKKLPKSEAISFEGIKINKGIQRRIYILDPKNHYRAGNDFEEFINNNQAHSPLKIKYYLDIKEVERNSGGYELEVIDANAFNGKEYERRKIHVNKELYNKIKSNILFIRTVDTGTMNGRAGLYRIKDVFGVDGILVSKARYRTHPIQIFIEPTLNEDEQVLLMDYFNRILEYFREKTDSEFMTTYKYSNSEYTRKYLGLSQVKKLIQTFPLSMINKDGLTRGINLRNLIETNAMEKLITLIKEKTEKKGLDQWF
ncbi:MAG: N-6 DNA methylase [Promethearchaeota archaeon]